MKTENINGFMWAVLDAQEATERFTNDREVYALCDDNTESLIEDETRFEWYLSRGVKMAVEIGAKEELTADYLETVERNKENRTFEDWCLSKIE